MAKTKVNPASGVERDQIEELEARLAELRGEDQSIAPTDYITVMSLFPGHLNLSTEEKGKGRTFRFDEFGTTKRMLYADLSNILETNAKFAEAGYFIILNPKVIRLHGLDDAYEKILTKDKIERIISGRQDAVELFSACNQRQKSLIISMLVEKLRDMPGSVDLNVVDRISRLAEVDIAKKASESREFFAVEGGEQKQADTV